MPERPLECSECKRPIAVCYTEVSLEKTARTWMCAECPVLQRKLGSIEGTTPTSTLETVAALVCGNCHTTLEDIRTGHALGCALCYEVFADVLVDELYRTHAISHHVAANKNAPLHMGRAPGEVTEISPTLRLIALNEALDEMLVREDYEQAALLRDQIRTLKEKTDLDERKKSG